MSNEFKIDGAGEGYEYTDSTGDNLWISEASLAGPGEDLYVSTEAGDGTTRAAYVNGKELCCAIAKTLGFKVRFEDELHEVEKPVERAAIEIQDAINETLTKLAEIENAHSTEDVDGPVKGESPWFEVVPRLRAAKVTEEFVRSLSAHSGSRLRPKYHEHTGQPLGLEYGDDEVKLIPVGDTVIVAPDGTVTSTWSENLGFEYRVVEG